jgi:DNA-binding response OmpR family regulator
MIRTLLERVAVRAGFEVDVAKDGLEALEMLGVKDYDIAIVDLMMPRMSGYELVQQISTMKPRPTVIVATAMMNGDVSTLDDSMVRRVIKKPFDVKAVANALIETALQIAEERRLASQAPAVFVVDESAVQEDSKNGASQKMPPPPEKPSS